MVEEINQDGKAIILFIIRDNGPGIDGNTLLRINNLLVSDPMKSRNSGFGIINVHARIAMMFGEEFGLQITSNVGKGTEVFLRIPKTVEPELK